MSNNNSGCQTTVDIPLPDGTKKKKHIRAKTKTELEKKKTELLRLADEGINIFLDDTFGFWAKQWFENAKAGQGLSVSQECNIRSYLNAINSMFEHVAFKRITLNQFQKFINQYAKHNPHTGKPTHAATLKKYRSTAVAVAKYASASGVQGVNVNAIAAAQIPRNAPTDKREALTPEQITMIEKTLHDMQPCAMLATFAGLRRAEVLGLQWKDIDLNAALLHVRRTVIYTRSGAPIVKQGGKTVNALRTVCMPPVLVSYLRKYRQSLSVYPSPNCFVVSNRKGEPYAETTLKRHWQSYMLTLNFLYGGFEKTDIRESDRLDELPQRVKKFTLHQCRHTFATMLYLEGIGVQDSMSLLGHADPTTTIRIYTDLEHFNRAELPDEFRQKLLTTYRIDPTGQQKEVKECLN